MPGSTFRGRQYQWNVKRPHYCQALVDCWPGKQSVMVFPLRDQHLSFRHFDLKGIISPPGGKFPKLISTKQEPPNAANIKREWCNKDSCHINISSAPRLDLLWRHGLWKGHGFCPILLCTCMVVDDVCDASHVPILPDLLCQVPHIFPCVILSRRGEIWVQLQLVSNRVAWTWLTQRLQWRQVDHIVTWKEKVHHGCHSNTSTILQPGLLRIILQ